MKRFISILLALCLAMTIEYSCCFNAAAAEKTDKTVISMEIGTYLDENKRGFFSADTIRCGREKRSARAGERIVITFILSGMAEMEYYQLSGHFNQDYLKPGYYFGKGDEAVWTYGDSEQDYTTVVDGSQSFGSSFEDSFSFTRTETEPTIYLCGYSMDGSAVIPNFTEFDCGYTVSGMPLISVGFEVQQDIENIYTAFEWNENSTYVSTELDVNDYYLSEGLSVGCNHQYEISTKQPDCDNDGYTLYHCIYCDDNFKLDYIPAAGHYYSILSVENHVFHYTCANCNSSASKTAEELYVMWNEKYINQNVNSTAVNDSCYLDVVSDKIINAKDFAVINKNSCLECDKSPTTAHDKKRK